jgi:hypothetical protein
MALAQFIPPAYLFPDVGGFFSVPKLFEVFDKIPAALPGLYHIEANKPHTPEGFGNL